MPTTEEEEKAIERFYNNVINELHQDNRWEKFCSLYTNDGRRDAILECYDMNVDGKLVAMMEKRYWEGIASNPPQTNNKTVPVAAVPQQRNRYLGDNVSALSKQPKQRNKYRNDVLLNQNFDGAFVAHKIYVEFVKAAHRMIEVIEKRYFNKDGMMVQPINEPVSEPLQEPGPETVRVTVNNNNNNSANTNSNTSWESKIKRVEAFANEIFHHPTDSMKNCDDLNLNNNVQLMLLTVLIQFAIVQEWDSRTKTECPQFCPIHVTHQGDVRITVEETDTVTNESVKNAKRNFASLNDDEQLKDTLNEANDSFKSKTVHQTIDILIWFRSKNPELGFCILSNVKYQKDNNGDVVSRIAHGDMNTTNILESHRVPSILVNITGGNNWKEREITATAIVPNNLIIVNNPTPQWCKSQLYTGQGADGFCALAAGLVSAYEYYPTEKDDLGYLLGPDVGKNGCKVTKAYINAEYHQPNLHLVKEFTDKEANLHSTANKEIQLLEMNYVESDWCCDIMISTFICILTKLLQLHNNGIVHGDIRLANMLSTGVLIDFDFAGIQNVDTYPRGYRFIEGDGDRHFDIQRAICYGTTASMTLETIHDCYSMAYVMQLFETLESSFQACWTSAADSVEKGEIQMAIDMLEGNHGMKLKLKEKEEERTLSL